MRRQNRIQDSTMSKLGEPGKAEIGGFMEDYPLLSFSCEFDELAALDVEEKGFFDHAIITLSDGSRYRLHFFTPARLAYQLKVEQEIGNVCIGEPGLVIVPRVTVQYMKEAAKQLLREGCFAGLKPIDGPP
jgi:hypothetical protein